MSNPAFKIASAAEAGGFPAEDLTKLIEEAARLHEQYTTGKLPRSMTIDQRLDVFKSACIHFLQACSEVDTGKQVTGDFDEDITMNDDFNDPSLESTNDYNGYATEPLADKLPKTALSMESIGDGDSELGSDIETDDDDLDEAHEGRPGTTTALSALATDLPKEVLAAQKSLISPGGSDTDRRVFIVSSYSNYGLNKVFVHTSRDPAEIKKGKAAIEKVLRQGPKIIENILGFKPLQEQYRHFILDGYKGNRYFDTIKDLACSHIPVGSRASEYIKAYAGFKPTDVIIIGQQGDGACFDSIVGKHKQMNKVVPDCLYHYLTYFDGIQATLKPMTSAMLLEAAADKKSADEEALALFKLIRGQSEGRHRQACAAEFVRTVGGSVKRNDLGLKADHGKRKLLSKVMNLQTWSKPQTCKEVMSKTIFKGECKPFGCSEVLDSDATLALHVLSSHYNRGNPLQCTVCGEAMKTPFSLRQHLSREIGISEMSCDDPICQILEANGISRRFNQARLAEHKSRCHKGDESAEEAKMTADLLECYRAEFPALAALLTL